jgi:hypothetical protein
MVRHGPYWWAAAPAGYNQPGELLSPTIKVGSIFIGPPFALLLPLRVAPEAGCRMRSEVLLMQHTASDATHGCYCHGTLAMEV